MLSDKNAALDVLQRALIYSPDIPELRDKFELIRDGPDSCKTSVTVSREGP